jgi:hypothetical protein
MVDRSDSLSDEKVAICGSCCQRTWAYEQPNGTLVQLDNASGPYLIADGKAFEVGGDRGYRRHSDNCSGSCPSASALPLASYVSDDDFLWP